MLKNNEIKILNDIREILDQKKEILTKDEIEVFNEFQNLIEKEIECKKERSRKSNAYNKANFEKHSAYNKEYYKNYYSKGKKKSDEKI